MPNRTCWGYAYQLHLGCEHNGYMHQTFLLELHQWDVVIELEASESAL